MEEEKYQWTPEYDEHTESVSEEGDAASAAPEPVELDPGEAEELAARIEARRRLRRRKRVRRKRLTGLCIILIFALLFTLCGREIFRLKAENYALKKQQEELKAERDRLQEELKKVDDKEYIKDQARRQLRLLNPGEIMFTFGDEEEESAEQDNNQDGK